MDNFKWEFKENMSKDDFDKVLEQHRNVVYAQGKSEVQKEYDQKIKDYETKVNSMEEQQLFSTIKDTKKVDLIKNLMVIEKYKNLSKQDAFNKVNEDYKEFLIDKAEVKQEPDTKQENNFNPKLLLDLHKGSIDPIILENQLKDKAKTTGITDPKELENLVEIAKNEALKSINQ